MTYIEIFSNVAQPHTQVLYFLGERYELSRARNKDFKLWHLWRTSLWDMADKRRLKGEIRSSQENLLPPLLIWTSILMGHLFRSQTWSRARFLLVESLPERGNGSHCGHQKCITYAQLSHRWLGLLSANYFTDSTAACRLQRNRTVKHPRANWR